MNNYSCTNIRTSGGPVGFMLKDSMEDGVVALCMLDGTRPSGQAEELLKELIRVHKEAKGTNTKFAYVECNTDTFNIILNAFKGLTDV